MLQMVAIPVAGSDSRPKPFIFGDSSSSTLNGKNTSDLESDIWVEHLAMNREMPNDEEHTLWSSPSANLSSKLDTNVLGAFEFPWNTSHDVNGNGTTNTTSNHTQTTGVRYVRVRSDHQSTRECVIFRDDLMNNARARFPESHIVLQSEMSRVRNGHAPAYRTELPLWWKCPKVIYLPINVDSALKIRDTSNLCLNQVVAVNGGGDGSSGTICDVEHGRVVWGER